AILPFDRTGKLLLIEQFRPAVGEWLLEAPAGTLERGEDPLPCAKRELIEETGFQATRWTKLGFVYTAPGFCSEKIFLYKAWDLTPKFAQADDDEVIELRKMTLSAALKAVRTGRIR